MRIGVLALQGDFAEHVAILRRLDAEPVEVRLPGDLAGLDGLIIPGGESTTMGKLLVAYDLLRVLQERGQQGMPIYGTCAGLNLLANDLGEQERPWLGLMNIRARRNAFGRQNESFETMLTIPALGSEPFPGIFIRAPYIERIGEGVETLASLDDGRVVAARQGNLLVSAFHPELSADTRFHRYFLEQVVQSGQG